MTKFGELIPVGEKHISMVSATSPSQGAVTQHPPNFWDLPILGREVQKVQRYNILVLQSCTL